jgi:hypothetical protein
MMGDTLAWLLEGDPSIRWQVLRDLLKRPPSEWEPVQRQVASEGWGAQILEHQDPAGRWTPRLYGKKWVSTTYSLVLLRHLGLPRYDARAAKGCRLFLDEALWRDGGIRVAVSQERSETCVTGMVLALLAWFEVDDPRRERLVEYLLHEQMEDGGWNCERDRGAVHASFHTTVSVLEGLREYVLALGPRSAEAEAAEALGREFFLRHRLYRSCRTGEVVGTAFTRLSFPPRWHHDILRTLDYFQAAGAPHDERLEDALRVLRDKRRTDGRWPLQNRHSGETYFEMEEVGAPSRWNTLRALRVLNWFDPPG